MKRMAIFSIMFIMLLGSVFGSGVTTDRLNFYTSEEHTVTVSNTLSGLGDSISTMPTGFGFVSSVSGCTNPSGQTVTCDNIASDGTAIYIINSTASGTEYELYTLNTTLNGTGINDVNFINIQNGDVWNVLIEFGRGRGNYFYNSKGGSTSAGTGIGYNYLPNATDFELNYLHKVFNIKQYFGLATSRATDVSFQCVYPFHTVVREHMVETITRDGSEWSINYSLPRIDGSWERMSYLGMDFDSGEYDVGDNITINCTNLDYNLADAYGHIIADEDSFELEIRSPDPLSMTASASGTIGNGTSEVVITYTFTNDESYPLDALMVEIDSPEEATFIGTRGELWGTSEDKFVKQLPNLEAGESTTFSLVARFDTSSSVDTTLLLTEGIKAKFVPTWELNSYNPMSYLQSLSVTDTIGVNYGVSSAIVSLQTQINTIDTNLVVLNTTTNNIYELVQAINNSMLTLETADGDILSAINNSRDTILTAINSSEGTVIANLTAELVANIGNLSFDTSGILTELEYMQGFNEELIFLVTDSVGLAEDGRKDFDNGNFEDAMVKFTKAGQNLETVQDEIQESKKVVQNNYNIETTSGIKKAIYWFKGLFL